jgi:glycosyltransferase involved in cell wall biosynthesis
MESPVEPRRNHVLQLLQGLNIGGIELMVASLVRGLDPAVFRSSFCTFDWTGRLVPELQEEGFTLHHRKRRGGWDLGWVVWFARLLHRERVDIVQAHNATALFYGALATSLVPGTRLLYTEHDRAFPGALQQRGLHALLARRTHAVATVSETLRGHLVRWERFPEQRVHVIRNGIEMQPPQRSRQAMRQELDLGDRPTAGIVARLAAVKNHAMLLRAWKLVIESVPQAVLLVVGSGTQEAALRGAAADLGISDSVRFLGFRRDIADLLGCLDVFVLSSFSEGLSLTLLEAEAVGLPVVATQVGGNPEVVQHERTGLLVPSDVPEAMASALARLLQDPNERSRLGNQGREYYREHFTLSAMLRGYTQLYAQLLGLPESSASARGQAEVVVAAGGGDGS